MNEGFICMVPNGTFLSLALSEYRHFHLQACTQKNELTSQQPCAALVLLQRALLSAFECLNAWMGFHTRDNLHEHQASQTPASHQEATAVDCCGGHAGMRTCLCLPLLQDTARAHNQGVATVGPSRCWWRTA